MNHAVAVDIETYVDDELCGPLCPYMGQGPDPHCALWRTDDEPSGVPLTPKFSHSQFSPMQRLLQCIEAQLDKVPT